MDFAERMEFRVARLQAWGQGVLDRVPPGVRRNGRRAFSFAFIVVIGTVLYRQLSGTDSDNQRGAVLSAETLAALEFAVQR